MLSQVRWVLAGMVSWGVVLGYVHPSVSTGPVLSQVRWKLAGMVSQGRVLGYVHPSVLCVPGQC